MRKKFLKLFIIYSYVSLVAYVGSENSLNITKAMINKKKGEGGSIKIESLWKTTLNRFKECVKLIKEN